MWDIALLMSAAFVAGALNAVAGGGSFLTAQPTVFLGRPSRLPLYVGGNAKRAIRRVVDLADGWNPFFTAGGGVNSATTRTASPVARSAPAAAC